ncbi:MAG: hypothetical protein ACTHK7_13505 [Aureliella sp.]
MIGYASNFDFWADEVAHCLAVIDAYPARFDRMQASQHDYQRNQPLPDFRHGEPFIPPRVGTAPGRIADELRRYVRAELCRAFCKFAIACYTHAHLSPHCIREQCQRLGIEIAESDVPA